MTKKQILIVSNPVDDKHVPRLVAELERLGHHWAIFDPGEILVSAGATASLSNEGSHSMLSLADGTQIVLEDIDSVWYRRPTRLLPRDERPAMERLFRQREAEAGIWGLLRGLRNAFWVNSPDAVRSAGHKPEQLQRAAALGLSIPRSLITNEPAALRHFYEECHGNMIYKLMGYPWYVDKDDLPLSAYTSLVPATMVQEAHRVSATLHLFQAFIVKRCDIRVTVIGEDVFAMEIHPLSESCHLARASGSDSYWRPAFSASSLLSNWEKLLEYSQELLLRRNLLFIAQKANCNQRWDMISGSCAPR